MESLGRLPIPLITSSSSKSCNLTVLANLSENPTPPDSPTPKKSIPASVGALRLRRKRNEAVQKPKQKQPSVAEIERAIGAGIFREGDLKPRESDENSSIFDMFLPNTMSQPAGSVEKKLRETGEWLIDSSRGKSGSAGQDVLFVVSMWILPVWTFLLLVASGLIKLPFSIPFLDDLIM